MTELTTSGKTPTSENVVEVWSAATTCIRSLDHIRKSDNMKEAAIGRGSFLKRGVAADGRQK